jgi:hypothetical protein
MRLQKAEIEIGAMLRGHLYNNNRAANVPIDPA